MDTSVSELMYILTNNLDLHGEELDIVYYLELVDKVN